MAVIINGDTGIDKITDGSVVAADIGAGEVTDAKLASGIDAAKLTGTLPALDASSLTGIPAPAALSTATGSAPSYSARAWVNFQGINTVTIRASGNVSSITDNGTGDYTINFTTAMPDANYTVAASNNNYSGGDNWQMAIRGSFATTDPPQLMTTSQVRMLVAQANSISDVHTGVVTIFR